MIRRSSLIVLSILLSLLFLESCYKERFSTDKLAGSEYNPELAIPLVKTRMTMEDITENSNEEWKEYPDGLLSLIYRQRAQTDLANDFVEIPDQSADTSFQVILPPSMIPGDSTSKLFSFQAEVNGSNNEIIDSIFFSGGFLDFQVRTDLNHDIKIQVIIPSLTRHGVTFIQTVDVPSAGGAMHTVNVSFPIVDHTALFDHPNGNDNVIDEYLKVFINFGAAANNSPYTLEINQGLRDVTYYFVSGYFGQYDITIDKEVLGVSLFDNKTVDEVFMEDPRLYLNFYNSFGLPISVLMDEFYVEKDGVIKDMVSTNLPSFEINPAKKQDRFDTTVVVFDKNNSNIVDLFNFQPKKVGFKEVLTSNPNGTPVYNFLEDTSKVIVEAMVELPLHGRTLNFTMQDSADLDIDEQEGVVSAELRVNLANKFPAEATLQIYLTDSNSVILDSLLPENEQLLVPAIVGPPPEYITGEPLNKTTVIKLEGERLKHFWDAKRVLYKATMSSSNQGQKIVKIYSDYYIDIRLAVKLNYLTEI